EPEPMQIESRDDVQNWVRAILGCQTVSIGGKTLELRSGLGLDLHLRLPDGRELTGSASGVKSDGEQVVLIGGVSLLAAPPLEELPAAGVASIRRAAQLRRGIALSGDDLRGLRATAAAIQMPPFAAATLRAELPRFSALEQLAVVPVGLSQLPTDDAIAAIAAVPTLRALVLPADALTDADIGALAALPLRELGLTGRLRGLTAAPFARLRTLEALALDVDSSTVDLRALLAALPAMKTFACPKPELVDGAIDALLATKVERLSLDGGKLDAPRLARLAQLPSLRELR